jgi:hypothetical protein
MELMRLKFNDKQITRIADIYADLGQILTASLVIPFLLEKKNYLSVVISLIFSFCFWGLSIYIERNNI